LQLMILKRMMMRFKKVSWNFILLSLLNVIRYYNCFYLNTQLLLCVWNTKFCNTCLSSLCIQCFSLISTNVFLKFYREWQWMWPCTNDIWPWYVNVTYMYFIILLQCRHTNRGH
jgi:hypothetical protein